MNICATVVFLVLFRSTATQDEAAESPEPASEVICQTCSCADGVVDCSGRGIRKPFELVDWDGLKPLAPTSVDLSGNALGRLTHISDLPIQTLNLSNCEIEEIKKSTFRDLLELDTLDLSKNRLSTSSINRRIFEVRREPGSEIRPFPKMRYLSLAYNDIHSLPQDLFIFLTEITTLDLSGNPLAYIDQVTMAAISELTKLKELRLSACELETLPEGLLRRQRRLERLDLSDNTFTTVPAVLNEAVNLVHLNFDKNPLTALEGKTAISNLTKLQELHLCRLSKLQSIGARALGGLKSLVTLHVCYNPRLTSLSPEFLMWEDDHEVERYPLLKELYLNNNNLTEINSHLLERWDTLVDVDFTSNPYVCDCNNQWMVDVLVPLISGTAANGSAASMFCKKPQDLRGLSFAQLRESSRTLVCSEAEGILSVPIPDMAILLGIMIGIFVTFPLVLIVVLLWRRGYFAKCRGRIERHKEYDEDETDAF